MCETRDYDELNALTDISNDVSNDIIANTIPTTIEFQNSSYLFDTLLDTGALQGNYVRRESINKLLEDGLVSINKQVNVCAAFNKCQTSSAYMCPLFWFLIKIIKI